MNTIRAKEAEGAQHRSLLSLSVLMNPDSEQLELAGLRR
jgi:hypothetical protein